MDRWNFTSDLAEMPKAEEVAFGSALAEMFCENTDWYVPVPGFSLGTGEGRKRGIIPAGADVEMGGSFRHPFIDARHVHYLDVQKPCAVRVGEHFSLVRGVAGARVVVIDWQGYLQRDITFGEDIPPQTWVKIWTQGGTWSDGVDGIAGRNFSSWWHMAMHDPAADKFSLY